MQQSLLIKSDDEFLLMRLVTDLMLDGVPEDHDWNYPRIQDGFITADDPMTLIEITKENGISFFVHAVDIGESEDYIDLNDYNYDSVVNKALEYYECSLLDNK